LTFPDCLEGIDDGNLALETSPDPCMGATYLALDPIRGIRRITRTSPIPGAMANAFTVPALTGPEPRFRPPLATAPVPRQTPSRRGIPLQVEYPPDTHDFYQVAIPLDRFGIHNVCPILLFRISAEGDFEDL
jgi:hypothetical protein